MVPEGPETFLIEIRKVLLLLKIHIFGFFYIISFDKAHNINSKLELNY